MIAIPRNQKCLKLQFYRYGPDLNDAGAIIDIPDNNNSVLFIYKQKITGETGAGGTKMLK